MNQEPKLSADLRTQLTQVFAMGYLDELKGSPIIDEDQVDGETVAEIEAAALECLTAREDQIHAIYGENPGRVYDQIFHAGRQAYRRKASAWLQRN